MKPQKCCFQSDPRRDFKCSEVDYLTRERPPGWQSRAAVKLPMQTMANMDVAAFDGYGTRDKPLGFHWKADFQELTDVVRLPWTGRANSRQVMASVFVDAAMEAKGLGPIDLILAPGSNGGPMHDATSVRPMVIRAC